MTDQRTGHGSPALAASGSSVAGSRRRVLGNYDLTHSRIWWFAAHIQMLPQGICLDATRTNCISRAFAPDDKCWSGIERMDS